MSIISTSILMSCIALIIGLPLGVIFTRIALNYIGIGISMGTPFGTMPGTLTIVLIILPIEIVKRNGKEISILLSQIG